MLTPPGFKKQRISSWLLRGPHPRSSTGGALPSAHLAAPRPPLEVRAHSPVRQSGFHGAHGVEGGLHGEFPGGVALAALLMPKEQETAELLTPGGQQGCKEGQDGQGAPWPPPLATPAATSPSQTGRARTVGLTPRRRADVNGPHSDEDRPEAAQSRAWTRWRGRPRWCQGEATGVGRRQPSTDPVSGKLRKCWPPPDFSAKPPDTQLNMASLCG